MKEIGLVGDLAAVAVAALAGGAAARWLGLPTMLGYLAAGIFLSPNTPGPVGDIDNVQTVAELGVALLLFTLGIKFSLRELTDSRVIGATTGLVVTTAMLGVGAGLGLAFGLSGEEAVIVGMVVSISSTMVALRLLEERGVIGTAAGRIGVVTALVQDIIVILFIVLIPVLAGGEQNVLFEVSLAIGEAVIVIAGVWVVGTIVLPRVLGRLAESRSRELFLLAIVALSLGTATLSFYAGLSVALGAFLAGLLISESPYAHRTLVEVFPLREVFSVVFFVSIGMLIEPDSFVDDTGLVVSIAAAAVAGKIVLIGGAAVLLGFGVRVAVIAAVALGNMGEFSFIIASQALEEDVVTSDLNDALLASVVLSVTVSPLLLLASERSLALAEVSGAFGGLFTPRSEVYAPVSESPARHAIVVGYTEAAKEVIRALTTREFGYVVVDEDPEVFRTLSSEGVAVVLGDAALPVVLEQASVDSARVLVVTTTNPAQVESVAAAAKALNKRIDVVARVSPDSNRDRLREIGVSRVVESEFEVGSELVRHTMQRFGLTQQEVQLLLARRRKDVIG